MRELRAKFEYVINCNCGRQYVYDKYDITNTITCRHCGASHKLNGTHDSYMLEKVHIYEYSKKTDSQDDDRASQMQIAETVMNEDHETLEGLSGLTAPP